VMSLPLEGGTAVTLASGLMAPAAIAVDNRAVYVATAGVPHSEYGDGGPTPANQGEVLRIPLDGSGAVVLASELHHCQDIALDDESVYVATLGEGSNDGRILRMPKVLP
jgi:hypothetical protein